jgi:hypothetical protein
MRAPACGGGALRARVVVALVGLVAGAETQAQPSPAQPAADLGAERCLQPDSVPMAARCELRHRYCAKPPNEAWRTRWRVVCGGAPGTAVLTGTATVEGGEEPRRFAVTAQVIWLPKEGSRTEFVPYGTLTFTGKSRDCNASETVELGPADGELEIKRGANGAPTHYRGVGFKAMDIQVLCRRSSGVIAGAHGADANSSARRAARRAAAAAPPVPWFNTAEDFRAVHGGQLQGEMKDPDGIWTWRWLFKP